MKKIRIDVYADDEIIGSAELFRNDKGKTKVRIGDTTGEVHEYNPSRSVYLSKNNAYEIYAAVHIAASAFAKSWWRRNEKTRIR